MQNLSKREVILLAIFLFLLLSYAGYEYLYKPFSLQIQELTEERELLQGKWQEIEGWTGQEEKLKEQTGILQKEMQHYEHAFLRDGQTSTFWRSVYQTAQFSGIKMVRIQEGQEKEGSVQEIPPFLIEVEGDYPAIKEFLRRLGTLPYHFAVSHGEFTIQGTAVHTTITLQWVGKKY